MRRSRAYRNPEAEEAYFEKLTEELDDVPVPGEARIQTLIDVERLGEDTFLVYDGSFAAGFLTLEEAVDEVNRLLGEEAEAFAYHLEESARKEGW